MNFLSLLTAEQKTELVAELCNTLAANRTFRETLVQAMNDWFTRENHEAGFSNGFMNACSRVTEAAVERVFQRHGFPTIVVETIGELPEWATKGSLLSVEKSAIVDLVNAVRDCVENNFDPQKHQGKKLLAAADAVERLYRK